MADRKPSRRQRAADQASMLEGWLDEQRSANTRAAYRCDLEMFGDWCARHGAIPLAADTATLVAFQAARQAFGDSDSTIRRRWSALSSFYDFVVEHDARSTNPTLGVDRPKVQSGDPSPTILLSDDVVASCRAVAAALDPRLDALVALLVCDGLKVTEALALDIEHVSGRSAATTITIRRHGEPKRIRLNDDTARAIRRCIGKRRSGPVFVNERSSKSNAPLRLTRFGADHLIRRLRIDDTTEPVTANALRRFHFNARPAGDAALEAVRTSAGLAHSRGVKRYDVTADPPRPSRPSRGPQS